MHEIPVRFLGQEDMLEEGIAYPLQFSWAFLVVQLVKNHLQCERRGFDPWVGKIPCRRKWQPTPVLLPGKFHGWRSLVGYSPWGHKSWTWLSDFTFISFSGWPTCFPTSAENVLFWMEHNFPSVVWTEESIVQTVIPLVQGVFLLLMEPKIRWKSLGLVWVDSGRFPRQEWILQNEIQMNERKDEST